MSRKGNARSASEMKLGVVNLNEWDKHLTSFGVQMLLRSVQMSMPVILERRRRLNAERSEAIERHIVLLESDNTERSEVPNPP